jgi:hypothetical protein
LTPSTNIRGPAIFDNVLNATFDILNRYLH